MRTHPSSEYKYPEYDRLSRSEKDRLQRKRNKDRRQRLQTIRSRPWKIHSERGIDLNKLPAGSIVPDIIRWRRWEKFVEHPAGYDKDVVEHFYANMHPPTFLHRRTVMMGKIQVRITPEDICNFYEVEHQPQLEPTFGLSNNPLFEIAYNGIIAAALRRNGSASWDSQQHKLRKSDMHYDMGFFMLFIKANLKPSTYCTTADEFVADILYSIQNNLPLDIGTIIWLEMMDTGHSLSRVLPFPCLITELCRRAGVRISDNLTKPKGPLDSRAFSFQQTSGQKYEERRHRSPQRAQGEPEFSSTSEPEYEDLASESESEDPDFDPDQPEVEIQQPPNVQQAGYQEGFQQQGFQELPPFQPPQNQFTEDTPQYLTQFFDMMQLGWTSTNERLDIVNNNMQFMNNNMQIVNNNVHYINQRMDWEGYPRSGQEAMGEQRRRRRRRHDGASGSGSGHNHQED